MRTATLAAVVVVSLVVLFTPSPSGEPGLPHADKVIHTTLFALLAAAALWRCGRKIAVLAALVAYALGSEVLQGALLPERQASVQDVVADLAGVVAVWVPAAWRGRRDPTR